MKYLRFFIIIFFVFTFQISKALENDLSTKITKNLRCLICQGQSVYDSDSEFANSVKILVSQKLDQGLTEKEIYIYLKNKFGQWILYEPEFKKNTYFLWLLPILMFLLGGAIIYKIFILKKID
jgi:cytochrome c-type biogenesis protein CcmH